MAAEAPLTSNTRVRLRIEAPPGVQAPTEPVVEVDAYPFVIGRKPSSNLVLVGDDVSSTHCMISEGTDQSLQLIDLQSTNGTLLDGDKIPERATLQVGSTINVGGVKLVVESDEGDETAVAQVKTSGKKRGVAWGKALIRGVTCPNCWHVFRPEEVFFVAKHPDLMGDPVLGGDEYLRFQPTRFNTKGEAIDPKGFATNRMACPRCHLGVPETLLEVPPILVSLIGSPASGKSYFLTAMSWELRRLMPRASLSFSDADPHANTPIHEYEQTLFGADDPDRLTEIRKTQTDDPRLYRQVMIDGAAIRFPVPLQFTVWPTRDHPHHDKANKVGRVVVLYDNAGEDYLPGAEEHTSAVVDHLARTAILMFLFDPTQDPRFRRACRDAGVTLEGDGRRESDDERAGLRQETLLREASVKIRRHRGLAEGARLNRPLIVVVPKFDVWAPLVPDLSLDVEPYAQGEDLESGKSRLQTDLERVEAASKQVQALFAEHVPEFVATAEGLSEVVRYIPVSSLGTSPELVEKEDHTYYGIRPRDIAPKWVTAPLLYCLTKWSPGLLEPVPAVGTAVANAAADEADGATA